MLSQTRNALTQQPMQVVWRYVWALVGGMVAMGGYIWLTSPVVGAFAPHRVGPALTMGLLFGHGVGFVVIGACDYMQRLRGVWAWWARLMFGVVAGNGLAALVWYGYFYVYLANPAPPLQLIVTGAVGLSSGFIVAGVLPRLHVLLKVVITALALSVALYASFQGYAAAVLAGGYEPALLMLANPQNEVAAVAIYGGFAVCVAGGGYLAGD